MSRRQKIISNRRAPDLAPSGARAPACTPVQVMSWAVWHSGRPAARRPWLWLRAFGHARFLVRLSGDTNCSNYCALPVGAVGLIWAPASASMGAARLDTSARLAR